MRIHASEAAQLLGARRYSGGWMARCPAHDDRSPSLSISEGNDGQLLLRCFAGCDFLDVLSSIRQRLGGTTTARLARAPTRACFADPPGVQRRKTRAAAIWRDARPSARTLVEDYLRARSVALPTGAELRFAPDLRHPTGAFAPAMVAAIRDKDSGLMGVHRTWLRPDGAGKAELAPAKAMLGGAAGGAVRLAATGSPLIVAEGVETTLSALAMTTGAAAWAALSASGLAGLELPSTPGALLIAADGDDAGMRAADALGERAEALGWLVTERIAPPGLDWNDVLREARHAAS